MVASPYTDNTAIANMAAGELGDATGNDVKVAIERLQLFKEKN
jgi:hypothetical protein